MPNNELRNELQQAAVDAVLEKKRLIVEWATGVGKSRTAIGSADELAKQGATRMLLLVVETIHKQNWINEFRETLGPERAEEILGHITMECYASLEKYRETQWDFIIADEAHHLRSDRRIDIFKTLKAEYMLCLSATMSDRRDADGLLSMLIDTFGSFERMRFGIKRAIEENVLARPTIYIHLMNLADVQEMQEVTLTWGWGSRMKERLCNFEEFKAIAKEREDHPNMKLRIRCTAHEGYAIYTREMEREKENIKQLQKDEVDIFKSHKERLAAEKALDYARLRIKNLGSRRKAFLGAAKTAYAKALLERLSGKRFVCFCSSVEQGNILNAENVIHSKKNAKENARIVRAFNDGETDSVFAIGMLQEGANLAGIEVGLMIQLDGKERPFVQKFGRTMRSTCPEQHILLFNHTQDINYYNNAFKEKDGEKNKYGEFVRFIDAATGKEYRNNAQ